MKENLKTMAYVVAIVVAIVAAILLAMYLSYMTHRAFILSITGSQCCPCHERHN